MNIFKCNLLAVGSIDMAFCPLLTAKIQRISYPVYTVALSFGGILQILERDL